MKFYQAAICLLLIAGVYADDKNDKKKNDSNTQRPTPAPRSAPAPAVRPEPPRRENVPNNQGAPSRNSGEYRPNPVYRGGERNSNTNNNNQNQNQGVYQPNNPNTGRQGVYQPNPDAGRQGRYERNTNPNTGRQGTYEPNPNPNMGRPGGYQPNNNPNTVRQGGYPSNPAPNTTMQGGYQTGRYPERGTVRTYTPGRTRDGGEIRPLTGGRTEYRGPNNTRAEFHRDGSVREVRSHDMVITHGPAGTRRVIVDRPDHTRIVTYGREHGYVQRTYTVYGHSYYQRTYYLRGVAYTRVYRPYYYGGIAYYGYVSPIYYRPAFYGWVFSPWATPVYFRWGWIRSPWYGYYGGYFAPYPVYPSAGVWLTDYVMSSNLQDAYQQQVDANVDMSGQVDYSQGGVTPEVKQAIADEVQRQLAAERAESQNPGADPTSGAPPFVDNSPHVFVVSTNLDVTTEDGMQCSVTQGDVLGMNGAPPPDATVASVRVMASKGQECRTGSIIGVSLEDLQEMQNHMREVIDQGLGELQSRQGQNGLPVVPAQARGELQSPVAAGAPPADPNAAAELTRQDQQATQTEQEVVNQAGGDPMPQPGPGAEPPPPATPTQESPVTISLGQTIDQVVALLGQPKQVVDLGAKKMYVYSEMKVIFIDGKVADVQ